MLLSSAKPITNSKARFHVPSRTKLLSASVPTLSPKGPMALSAPKTNPISKAASNYSNRAVKSLKLNLMLVTKRSGKLVVRNNSTSKTTFRRTSVKSSD